MSASDTTTYSITVCRGVQGGNCRFAISAEDALAERLEALLARLGWAQFLTERTIGPIPAHSRLSIGVTACPNGCAKPQVADIGIIRASRPMLDASRCNCCSLCYRACPDEAITMGDSGPLFCAKTCMDCGLCVMKCREKAITPMEEGYRVMIGGKLGRHPRLATVLEGIHDIEQVLLIVENVVLFYMCHYRKKLRLGTLMEEQGDKLLAVLRDATLI